MSDPYTPSTQDVRSQYREKQYGEENWGPFHHDRNRAEAEFDRWLAAHDAEVRAEAEAERNELLDEWRLEQAELRYQRDAAVARAEAAEAERDEYVEEQNQLAMLIPDAYDGDEYQGALIERFVRDAAGRFADLVSERDALAARVDALWRARLDVDCFLSWQDFGYEVGRILDADPADILRERDAEKWDEGHESAVEHGAYFDPNPYRTRAEQDAQPRDSEATNG